MSKKNEKNPQKGVIQTVKLADLKFGKNPRTVEGEGIRLLEESLKRLGNLQPIVVNVRTGEVLAGEQRCKAMKAQGIQETDAWMVDLPQDEAIVANMVLNQHVGEWDTAGATALLNEINDDELKTLVQNDFGEEPPAETQPDLEEIDRPPDSETEGDWDWIVVRCRPAQVEEIRKAIEGSTDNSTLKVEAS